MSTATPYPTLTRPAEPPWRVLIGAALGLIVVLLLWALAFAPESTRPIPTVAFTGKVGPAGLKVTATPLKAGAPAQALTLEFTRPRTGAPYEILETVRVRMLAPAGGAPGAPLKATMVTPGKWELKLPANQLVTKPGTRQLRVSASIRAGQAFKQTVPLAYK